MLSRIVGDTVRIQTKEWMDAQEKDAAGCIEVCGVTFNTAMQKYAGKIATILNVEGEKPGDFYTLDIDSGEWAWTDQMFDPCYRPEDEPLSTEDAIHAMMDKGEALYDKSGNKYYWDKDDKCFYHQYLDITSAAVVYRFKDIYYRAPVRPVRPMTIWEILAWANSEESRGWVVMLTEAGSWRTPQFHAYDREVDQYQRARLRPDNSGIDESTIQDFEVEE
jgi:hypothetical protein